MKENTIQVSIIMPSYNKGKFIRTAVNSVAEQTYQDWELIIVDDASTDQTAQILSELEQQSQIQVLWNDTCAGANKRRNQGLQQARGSYVLFFDADDIMDNTCLENRITYASQHQESDFWVTGARQFIGKVDNVVNQLHPDSDRADLLHDFLTIDHSWQTSQILWRKDFLLRAGGFDENFSRFQDIELNTRVLLIDQAKYSLNTKEHDCNIRISNDRLTMSHYEMCKRTMESIIRFSVKFQEASKQHYGRPVHLGSIAYGLQVVGQYFIHQAITEQQFDDLCALFWQNEDLKYIGWWKKRQFRSLIGQIKKNNMARVAVLKQKIAK